MSEIFVKILHPLTPYSETWELCEFFLISAIARPDTKNHGTENVIETSEVSDYEKEGTDDHIEDDLVEPSQDQDTKITNETLKNLVFQLSPLAKLEVGVIENLAKIAKSCEIPKLKFPKF